MPPKKPAPATGNKKTQEKKKEKIIEVNIARVSMSVFAVSSLANGSYNKLVLKFLRSI